MTIDKPDNSPTQTCGLAKPTTWANPRVYILSDFRLLREGMSLALTQQSSVHLVGASDLSAPLHQIASLAPDALLLDLLVPGSLNISRLIRDAMPGVRIIALGVAEVEQVVMECARAGVSGFAAPSASVTDVVEVVHAAVRGELICSPRMSGMLLGHITSLAARPVARIDNESLTQRETEIAQLVSEGLSNKQIARSLGICGATVKNHVHSILSKLGMRRRVEIAAQSRHRRMEPSGSLAAARLRTNGSAVHNGNGTGPDHSI
jgi:two-component system, NarL family, nitrate/nitrite response regulator NarL